MGNYLKSENVKIYPSAYRGRVSGDASKYIDPESRLPTENNISGTIRSVTAFDSFVANPQTSYSIGDKITFVIHGYKFEVKLTSDILSTSQSDLYAFIRLANKNGQYVTDDIDDYPATSLVPVDSTTYSGVGVLDATSGTNTNCIGLYFSDSATLPSTISSTGTYKLHLLQKAGSLFIVPLESRLVLKDENIKSTKPLSSYINLRDELDNVIHSDGDFTYTHDATFNGETTFNDIAEFNSETTFNSEVILGSGSEVDFNGDGINVFLGNNFIRQDATSNFALRFTDDDTLAFSDVVSTSSVNSTARFQLGSSSHNSRCGEFTIYGGLASPDVDRKIFYVENTGNVTIKPCSGIVPNGTTATLQVGDSTPGSYQHGAIKTYGHGYQLFDLDENGNMDVYTYNSRFSLGQGNRQPIMSLTSTWYKGNYESNTKVPVLTLTSDRQGSPSPSLKLSVCDIDDTSNPNFAKIDSGESTLILTGKKVNIKSDSTMSFTLGSYTYNLHSYTGLTGSATLLTDRDVFWEAFDWDKVAKNNYQRYRISQEVNYRIKTIRLRLKYSDNAGDTSTGQIYDFGIVNLYDGNNYGTRTVFTHDVYCISGNLANQYIYLRAYIYTQNVDIEIYTGGNKLNTNEMDLEYQILSTSATIG